MPNLSFPYGLKTLKYDIPDNRLSAVLTSQIDRYVPGKTAENLIAHALGHPTGTPALHVMAQGKNNVVLLCSDHTRPVPSRLIAAQMLAEIRKGNPKAHITLLIASGCHRDITRAELVEKFGEDIVSRESIVIHDCDRSPTAYLGALPSGGDIRINRLAAEADLLLAEGLIEPHFFAGFSGGRKSVFPGIACRESILYNHNAAFIDSPYARTGNLSQNPIHLDMLHAARAARLAFICNVVQSSKKETVYAAAGDMELAHADGCGFLAAQCRVKSVPSDIVISTNGGYPLDQNIYQAVKGMTAAEATVKQGGVIIMLAQSADGHGGEAFFKTFAQNKDLRQLLQDFAQTPKAQTKPDQWQSQLFIRVLSRAHVIYVSDLPDDMVSAFRMIPAKSIEDAVSKADALLGCDTGTIAAIPDGVSVIVDGH